MRALVPRPDSLRARLTRAWDSDVLWSFRHSPMALGAALIALLLILGAVSAPWIAPQNPFDPASLNLLEGFSRPGEPNAVTGRSFVLGADSQGRDVYSHPLTAPP